MGRTVINANTLVRLVDDETGEPVFPGTIRLGDFEAENEIAGAESERVRRSIDERGFALFGGGAAPLYRLEWVFSAAGFASRVITPLGTDLICLAPSYDDAFATLATRAPDLGSELSLVLCDGEVVDAIVPPSGRKNLSLSVRIVNRLFKHRLASSAA